MTRRRMMTSLLTALFVPVASLRAHPNYRIIGTIESVTTKTIAVKQTRDGRIIAMEMDNESRVTRDKKDVSRTALKPGLSVVVDACGDSLEDLLVMEIRLVPAPSPRPATSLLATLCLVVFAPLAGGAQTVDADLKEIQAYTLTAPVLKQVMTATRTMIGAVKEEGDVARLQGAVSNVIGKSLTDIELAIEKEPLVAGALKKSGISARDYAKFVVVFLQTSMMHNMHKSGAVKELPPTANMANLKFVESHQTELNALMAEFQALNKLKGKVPGPDQPGHGQARRRNDTLMSESR